MKHSSSSIDWNIDEVHKGKMPQTQTENRSNIKILFYEKYIPSFVEIELERLYSNIHSSINKLKVLGILEGVSTYIVQEDGAIVSLFLFRLDRKKVKVVNEVIKINEAEICRFSEFVFSQYSWIRVISFRAIETNVRSLPFPFFRFNVLEDLVISLPGSEKEYLASLGSATRRNIKYYSNKIKRNFPSFKFEVFQKEQITEEHVKLVLHLRTARAAEKNNSSAGKIKSEDIERTLAMVKSCGGVVGLAVIDGNVCAGQISYRLGRNDFGAIIAHSPKYNDYWLGVITCYLTICDCIAHGGKEFHFQWGRHEYKYRLLGVQRDLDNIDIYRSYYCMISNIHIVVIGLCKSNVRRIKLWLLDSDNRHRFVARVAISSVRFLHRVQRSAVSLIEKIYRQ